MGCARTKKEEGSMAALKGLKPEKVFEYFEKLCSVPHGSGNTKLISDLCAGFAGAWAEVPPRGVQQPYHLEGRLRGL